MSTGSDNPFDPMLNAVNLFAHKEALTEHFLPDRLPFREQETQALARILAPCLRSQPISNALIYGNPGTGKTAVTQFVLGKLKEKARQLKLPILVLYVNCGMKGVADTEYRAIREFVHTLGKPLPHRGLSKTEIYESFFGLIDRRGQHVIVVFDEIDSLMRNSGSQFLYTLTRIELKRATLSFVGITNNITLMSYLDGRIRSSLSQQQVIFPPYKSDQLTTILSDRVQLAFRPQIVDRATISVCAALGAQEHGDARRSLKLLLRAGEIAESTASLKVSAAHVQQAEAIIDQDTTLRSIRVQPAQHGAVLHAILSLSPDGEKRIRTGDVYSAYCRTAPGFGLKVLTMDRVSHIIADLDLIGLVQTQLVHHGRWGRSREIVLSISDSVREQAAQEIKTKLNLG